MAPAGLTIIVGEEVKTAEGDLICVFLERAIPPGMSAMETIAAAREQGGLVGIPHPFDRMRGSLLRDAAMASLAPHVDWVESHNARVVGHGNEDAPQFAMRSGPARHRRVGCALDHGDRRRLHRARWRSVDARRACWPRWPASRSSPAAPPTSSGSGPRRQGRQPACAATGAFGPGPPTAARPARLVARDRSGRAGPSTDVRRDGRSGRVRCDGSHSGRRPHVRPPPRPRIAGRSPRDGADRGRADLARSAADPAADDPVDRRPARDHRLLPVPEPRAPGRRPDADPPGQPRARPPRGVVFYLGFPLRGYRWQRLLRETGFIIGLRNSTEILYISWFVNCVVPAKLGDVYRAYLLKMNSDASLSRTFGTVFIERILDIFAIAILGLAAGFWSFRLGMPPADPDRLRGRHRDRHRGRRRAVHHAQLRTPDPDPAAAPAARSWSCTSGSRRACSAPSGCATCRCWRS